MAPSHHWIKPNETCRTPTSLAFIGVEYGERREAELQRGAERTFNSACLITARQEKGVVTRRSVRVYRGCAALWQDLYRHSANNRTTWAFAYDALHAFTLAGLFNEMEADRLWLRWKGDKGKAGGASPAKGDRRKPGFLCLEDRPFIVELLHGTGRLRLLDVRNYYDESRETLYRDFLPGDDGGDDSGERCLDADNPAVRDAKLVERCILPLLAWWREIDGGVFKSTAAGLAWNNYRHKHMSIPICCHSNAEALELEKGCYYGGVVEARYRGVIRDSGESVHQEPVPQAACLKGPIYQVDVSSMYPSIMRHRTFPRRLVFNRTCRDWSRAVKDLTNAGRAYGCCAVVQLDTPDYPYPVRIDGRTCHAYGRLWTCLPGPELAQALDMGHVRKVAGYSAYSVGRIFRSYADYWIGERQRQRDTGHDTAERFAKLMGNSLYGRFAARKRRWIDRPDLFTDLDWGAWPTRSLCRGHEMNEKRQCIHCKRQGGEATRHPVVSFRAVAGYVQEKSCDELSGGAFPAISAWVTSYGRLLLRSLLDRCPQRSVLYVDTDGFLCTGAAIEALSPKHIGERCGAGEVRIVRAVAAGEIVGCRAYRLGDEWVTAGCPADATPRPEGGWKFDSQQSAAELLAKRPDGTVKVVERTFAYDNWHRADRYGPDGWLTPLTLDQAEIMPF